MEAANPIRVGVSLTPVIGPSGHLLPSKPGWAEEGGTILLTQSVTGALF